MQFYIAPTNAERVSLQPLIVAGGGELLKSWRAGALPSSPFQSFSNRWPCVALADAVTLAPASAAVALTAGTVVYDVRFVTESVAQAKALVSSLPLFAEWHAFVVRRTPHAAPTQPLEDFRLRPMMPANDA